MISFESPFLMCYLMNIQSFKDLRGEVVKPYFKSIMECFRVDFQAEEVFLSKSHKNVIRGMHMSLPPFDGGRLIYCSSGSVLDVLIDLRPDSSTYLKIFTSELSGSDSKLLYVPPGVAHGFKSLSNDTEMVYVTSQVYKPMYDGGVNLNSIGYDWEISNPIVSARDNSLPNLTEWQNPYTKIPAQEFTSIFKKILITGCNGFIGNKALNKFSKLGYECAAVVRKSVYEAFIAELDDPSVKTYSLESDYSNISEIFKDFEPDVIVHIAASTFYELDPSNLREALDGNALYGLHILEAMRVNGIKRIINTGTSWQHFKGSSYRPLNLYAAMKKAFEDLCDYYCDAHDFQILTLKLFDTYGIGDKRKKIFSQLQNLDGGRNCFEMSSGVQYVDIVSAEDVANAYVLSLHYLNSETPFNLYYAVATRKHVQLKSIVEHFVKDVGLDCKIKFGSKQHRTREIFYPWLPSRVLPNWAPNPNSFEEFCNKTKIARLNKC